MRILYLLHEDEEQSRQRLTTKQGGLNEGITGKAAERLDLVLHHGRQFGLLDLAEVGRREAQDAVVEFVAQAAQHALAHAALLGVDRLLEQAVDHDGAQEDEAHDDEVLELIDLEAVEEADHLAGQDGRQVEFPDQERDGLAVLERVAQALDDVVGAGGFLVGNHPAHYDQGGEEAAPLAEPVAAAPGPRAPRRWMPMWMP